MSHKSQNLMNNFENDELLVKTDDIFFKNDELLKLFHKDFSKIGELFFKNYELLLKIDERFKFTIYKRNKKTDIFLKQTCKILIICSLQVSMLISTYFDRRPTSS